MPSPAIMPNTGIAVAVAPTAVLEVDETELSFLAPVAPGSDAFPVLVSV